MTLLEENEQSRGNPSIMEYIIKVYLGNGIAYVLIVTSEIIIYMIFFRYIYKHNNNERLRRLLEPEVLRRRNKTNAITFFGQFCSFAFEFTVYTLITLAYTFGRKINHLWPVALAFSRMTFGVMAAIEVITSPVLRARMFNIDTAWMYNIIFGLK